MKTAHVLLNGTTLKMVYTLMQLLSDATLWLTYFTNHPVDLILSGARKSGPWTISNLTHIEQSHSFGNN